MITGSVLLIPNRSLDRKKCKHLLRSLLENLVVTKNFLTFATSYD